METQVNEEEKDNKGLYWIITLASLAIGIFSPYFLFSIFLACIAFLPDAISSRRSG
jgi:hypothetical protein